MNDMTCRRLVLAVPHGFCGGVARAVRLIETALAERRHPVYCLNEIVHNRQVVEDLAGRGVVFVKSLGEIPCGATVVFSAHGVSPTVRAEAAGRGLQVVDATCPYVKRVHEAVRRYAAEGYTILLIGHRTHEEIIGVAGEAPDRVIVVETLADARAVTVADPDKVVVMSQTTLNVEDIHAVIDVLAQQFPALLKPRQSDICYATFNRQHAVTELVKHVSCVLVLGSPNSSNTKRLVEVAERGGARAWLVPSIEALTAIDLADCRAVGLTAGASTPARFVQTVIDWLCGHGFGAVERLEVVDEKKSLAH